MLSSQLMISERVIRAEIDFLKAQGLLEITPAGMVVTAEGERLIAGLAEYIHKLRGLYGLEQMLAKKLGLRQAMIIPGDADADETVKKEMGQTAARVLEQHIFDGATLAVSGGTTMAEVACAMKAVKKEVLVLPARGSRGEEVEYQANTIAAQMAKKMGGSYRLLYLPDLLSPETVDTIAQQDAGVREILGRLKETDVLMLSINKVSTLAGRQRFMEDRMRKILQEGATGEALGYCFNIKGEVVYATHSAGLHMEDVGKIAFVIAVSGGRSKAEAILSVMRHFNRQILVTDEAAAREIIALMGGRAN